VPSTVRWPTRKSQRQAASGAATAATRKKLKINWGVKKCQMSLLNMPRYCEHMNCRMSKSADVMPKTINCWVAPFISCALRPRLITPVSIIAFRLSEGASICPSCYTKNRRLKRLFYIITSTTITRCQCAELPGYQKKFPIEGGTMTRGSVLTQ
jgi:hypothetical protein